MATIKKFDKSNKLGAARPTEYAERADPNAPHPSDLMRVPQIEISLAEALVLLEGDDVEKMSAYDPQSRDAGERAMAEAYKAVASGAEVISLRDLLAASLGGHMLPRKGFAPAKAAGRMLRCVRYRSPGLVRFAVGVRPFRWAHDIDFPTFNPPNNGNSVYATTTIPYVPALAKKELDLNGAFLIWETNWATEAAPTKVNPIAVRHVVGDLYTVLGTWQLNKLEIAALNK